MPPGYELDIRYVGRTWRVDSQLPWGRFGKEFDFPHAPDSHLMPIRPEKDETEFDFVVHKPVNCEKEKS